MKNTDNDSANNGLTSAEAKTLKDLQAKIKSNSAKELQQQQDTRKFVFYSIILITLLKNY